MKPNCYCRIAFAITVATLFFVQSAKTQNTFPPTGAAGIGTTSPDPSSLFEVVSTSKGILISRMTKTQRDAIITPSTGLLIYQTNSTPGFYYYDGSKWTAIAPKGVNKSLSNLTAPTAVNVSLLPVSNNSVDLGSSSSAWRNIYAGGGYYIDTSKVLDIAGTGNSFIGQTTNSTNTGSYNTFVGYLSGKNNTSGRYNNALGVDALGSNTFATDNNAFGANALYSNITGSRNCAIGNYSLFENTAGFNNNANGYSALYSNTSGNSNTAFGNGSLNDNVSGSFNSAFGDSANVSSGSLNNATAIGAYAFVSASNSLVLGSINGVNNASGSVNVGIGTSSPAKRLHVQVNGPSGATSLTGTGILLEDNATTYLSILSPASSQNGILFGNPLSNQKGAIVFNNSSNRSGLQFNAGGVSRITLDSTGDVGIGNFNPAHRLELNTDDAAKPSTSTWTIASDAKLKTNISDFRDGLDVVKKIHPVWFEYNGKAQLPMGVRSVGIVAQEMQKIAPYMIGKYKYTDSVGKANEYLDYNANALFYLLVNSVKELSATNDGLAKANDELKNTVSHQQEEIDELRTMVQILQQTFSNCNACNSNNPLQSQAISVSGASLEQNIPNPFNHTTTINYWLPQQYSSAKVIVTDKSGKVLKAINLSASGQGSTNLDAAVLASGAYQYSLLIDGKLIATKQMIIAK